MDFGEFIITRTFEWLRKRQIIGKESEMELSWERLL